MTKLCFISEFLSNDTPFYTSFNNDCIKIIHPEDFDCSTALDGIDLTQITHVAFFYHFPGHFKVPFFYEHIDDINNNFISNCLITTSFNEGTYFRSYLSMIHYFNHIKEVGKGLLVDNRTLYKM